MLASFPFAVFMGILLGFLAGIGVGGGSLLIIWLTLILQVPAPEARIINLLFFIPSALIACILRWKQRTFNLAVILPAIVAGCICAAIFSQLNNQIDQSLARKLFGALLLFTGVREILYKPKAK